jgi:DNA polymerase-3 subunit alpha
VVLLEKEKALIGIYLSSHPLDEYRLEIDNFTSREYTLRDLNNTLDALKGKEITFAGMVTEAREAVGKTGKPYCSMVLTDYNDSYTIYFLVKTMLNFPNIANLTCSSWSEDRFRRVSVRDSLNSRFVISKCWMR